MGVPGPRMNESDHEAAEDTMALSEQEQRMLAEIESALYAEDPKFGSTMSGKAADLGGDRVPRGFSPRVIAIIAVGLALLIGGVAGAQMSLWFLILSVVGFLAMFGAGVWALTGTGDKPGLVSVGSSAKGGGKSNKAKKPRKPRQSGGLEDRFRGRFEGR